MFLFSRHKHTATQYVAILEVTNEDLSRFLRRAHCFHSRSATTKTGYDSTDAVLGACGTDVRMQNGCPVFKSHSTHQHPLSHSQNRRPDYTKRRVPRRYTYLSLSVSEAACRVAISNNTHRVSPSTISEAERHIALSSKYHHMDETHHLRGGCDEQHHGRGAGV